jgi:hypothetical protein
MSKEKKIWKTRRGKNGRGDGVKNIRMNINEKKALKWSILKVGRKQKNEKMTIVGVIEMWVLCNDVMSNVLKNNQVWIQNIVVDKIPLMPPTNLKLSF